MLTLALFGALVLPAAGHASDGSGGVSAGGTHTCAIDALDSISCWGSNGNPADNRVTGPNGAGGSFKSVSAGEFHTCAIDADDDSISCWGNNGNPADNRVTGPDTASGPFKSVSAGNEHTCAIDADDDSISCWGTDTTHSVDGPDGAGGPFKSVSASNQHTCAIDADDDSISCWGFQGAQDNRVSGPNHAGGTFKSVSAGQFQTCAIDSADSIDCWGLDDNTSVSGPSNAGGTFKAVSTSTVAGYTCAIDMNDRLQCWGNDNNGRVSLPNAETGNTFKAVSTGSHTCAIHTSNRIECWGLDGVPPDGRVSGPNGDTNPFGTPGGTTDPLAVTNTNEALLGSSGPGSLRRAIWALRSAEDANPRISITATGTISLQNVLPNLESVVIDGPGADQLTVNREPSAGSFRIFTIPASTTVQISDLSATNGLDGSEGGAIRNSGDLTLRGVSLRDNRVRYSDLDGFGGAIMNQTGATLFLFDSTLANNSVARDSGTGTNSWGGAIVNNGTFVMRNSTLTGNSASAATNAQGGAIWTQIGTAQIRTSTIVANTAAAGANIYGPTGEVYLQSTIVADPAGGANCAGAAFFFSESYNLSDSAGCGLIAGAPYFDQTAEPLLGALAFNGGPTQTMLPSLQSPAIDNGFGFGGAKDQRGFARTADLSGFPNGSFDGGTDVGAVEVQDTDADGIADVADNCPTAANPGQADADGDGSGDACDDSDGDGVVDSADNCSAASNPGQQDADGDAQGDACDVDDDGDGVADASDNCTGNANPGQEDIDSDGSGDACDSSDDRTPPDGGGGGSTTNCTVPPLQRGSRLGAVRSALEAAHCTLGNKTRKFSSKVKRGRLVRLKTRAGTVLAAGAAVDVVLSKGPR